MSELSGVFAPSDNRDGDRLTARVPSPFDVCAWLFLAAALVAAAARAIEPFAHGIWLVAYLFLVGFLAQFLLGRGQATALAARRLGTNAAPIGTQATLWNTGVVAVPVGVLVEARLFVVLGSVALLTALALFWQTRRRRRPESRAAWASPGLGYVALIAFMAASVLVGTVFAWHTPWL